MNNEMYADIEEGVSNETFTIDDDSKAEWALKKILEERKEKDRLLSLVDAQRKELDMQELKIIQRYVSNTAYLTAKLQEYFMTVKHKKTKTQETYQLLSGKLVMKTPQIMPKQNEKKLVEWCKKNAPEYIKTTYKVDWNNLKKNISIVDDGVVLNDTGEVVDGVSVEQTACSFDVK